MRRPVLIAVAFMALFLGGAAVGLWLAELLAPGSWLANVVSFFVLPVAFATGLQAWYGLALLSLIPRLLFRRLAANRPIRSASAGVELQGSWLFVPISSAFAAAGGLVAGIASPTQSVWLVTGVYGLVGTVYGVAAWRLARAGFLLPPETA